MLTMSATSAYIIILVIIIVIVVGITSIITKVMIARLLFHVRSSPLILPGRRRSGYVTARAAQAEPRRQCGRRLQRAHTQNDNNDNNSNKIIIISSMILQVFLLHLGGVERPSSAQESLQPNLGIRSSREPQEHPLTQCCASLNCCWYYKLFWI